MASDTSVATVTILGSGTCVPSLKRSSCSILLETGGIKILVDAGTGTLRRLLEAGIRIFEISYIFFSHFHPDHTAEIVPFLFATKYPEVDFRKTPLTMAGGAGFIHFFNGLRQVFGHWIDLPDEMLDMMEFDNRSPEQRDFGPFRVETTSVEHNEESIAYKFTTAHGKTLVYSGDTDYSENLITLAQNVDLLICESSFPEGMKVRGHLTPSLAGEMAAKAAVHKLMLIHFYPECDRSDIWKACRQTYSGPLVLAEDLARFPL